MSKLTFLFGTCFPLVSALVVLRVLALVFVLLVPGLVRLALFLFFLFLFFVVFYLLFFLLVLLFLLFFLFLFFVLFFVFSCSSCCSCCSHCSSSFPSPPPLSPLLLRWSALLSLWRHLLMSRIIARLSRHLSPIQSNIQQSSVASLVHHSRRQVAVWALTLICCPLSSIPLLILTERRIMPSCACFWMCVYGRVFVCFWTLQSSVYLCTCYYLYAFVCTPVSMGGAMCGGITLCTCVGKHTCLCVCARVYGRACIMCTDDSFSSFISVHI